MAKLINRPGVFHAPLKLNHPKSEHRFTLTGFQQPLWAMESEWIPRVRAWQRVNLSRVVDSEGK